jgi:protein involved in temperature-dependent protein secretion
MTLLWLVVWFIADQVGGREPLLLNPMNAWTATLILAIALDLGGSHARGGAKRERATRRTE